MICLPSLKFRPLFCQNCGALGSIDQAYKDVFGCSSFVLPSDLVTYFRSLYSGNASQGVVNHRSKTTWHSTIKRDGLWWIDISHQGRRIRKTTGTEIKKDAQQFHDQFKSDLWRYMHLNEKPQKAWPDAVTRWFEESKHKRTLDEDRKNLRWAHPYLHRYLLCDIDTDVVEKIAKAEEATGVKPATVNRLLAVIRSILRKAKYDWSWTNTVPKIRLRKEDNQRIRWLTQNEAILLLKELPEHLRNMAGFTLATGLRASNVTELCWKDVDLQRAHALIHPDQSKSKKAIPIPLNEDAINILKKQIGKNPAHVFTYKGKSIEACSTRAWKKALKRANISNFRWHDLRHYV